MSRGVNKVILVGNVGRDPECSTSQGGAAIANLSLATSASWKDRNTGEQKEVTEWHRLVCFNKKAELVRDYIKKGSKLYIEGELRTRKWQSQGGEDHYTTEIIVNEIEFLDSRNQNSGDDNIPY